jgi:acetyl-CoA synthetase (ADP-forming)/acetyltransferase
VFGPVVFFGQGGIAADVAADRAAGLPPLNMALARDMVSRTRVAPAGAGPDAGRCRSADRTLVQVADMVADLPELTELDLNPLLAIGGSVVALGARMHLAKARARRGAGDPPVSAGTGRARGLGRRADPAAAHPAGRRRAAPGFFSALDPDDVRLRFFTAMRELPPAQLARLTQIDYDRAMAFIATRPAPPASRKRWAWCAPCRSRQSVR